MHLYNSLGRQLQSFKSITPREVKIFTCGPSVYQRPHIGNYRTFLYEDILVRYLEYKGYKVIRSMNLTDIEDKAVSEAIKNNKNIFEQTQPTKEQFLKDLKSLYIKEPILAMASSSVNEAIDIIQRLMDKGYAYEYKGSIFFDPLKDKDFGKLYGLDLTQWPKTRKRYKLDTYPGMRWNLGDFILWHKADKDSYDSKATWDSPWGKGRPSWNVQDPAMIIQTLGPHIDINCGGIDNIIRHHDYNISVMESAFKAPYANYYMHGAHLYIDGKKMSKSQGNIIYPYDLLEKNYPAEDIRYFLTAIKHYRKKLNFTLQDLNKIQYKRKIFLNLITDCLKNTSDKPIFLADKVKNIFEKHMENDLDVPTAIKEIALLLKKVNKTHITEKQTFKTAIQKIDDTLKIGLNQAL